VQLPAAEWLNPAQPLVVEAPTPPARLPIADLRGEPASRDVRQVADWIAESHDAGGMDFLIIDKRNAKLFVFDADAHLRGAAPMRRPLRIPAVISCFPTGSFMTGESAF
jgi:hypothetical protein